jgi:putative MATE family efflux protein
LNTTTNQHSTNTDKTLDPRTRRLLEAPIASTLLKMAGPSMLVMVAQTFAGLIETYFVGKLGTDALAAMSLVFPLVMFMQMTSAGAMGGGIASSIARALGARSPEKANSLVFHALVIAIGFGILFMVGVMSAGPWLYQAMGGRGASLDNALLYSNWVFGGAIIIWLFNALSAIIRGTGNMNVPAVITCVGTVFLIPLSPILIFGWGPIPALGIAGGAIAFLIYYIAGSIAFIVYLYSKNSLLKPRFAHIDFEKKLFWDILKIGLVGTISTVATNLTIGTATSMVGQFGDASIAGYGTGSRIEYVLVPIVFGFGAPLVAMVGACIGAGNYQRAIRVTWIGAAMATGLTELIGLLAALHPVAWLSLFDSDPAMIQVGTQYLQIVGPFYGFFGLALILYFASQGAGRLFWPVMGNVVRLVVAIAGGMIAISLGWGLIGVFVTQALALLCYGLFNATAIAKGAWTRH